jgi:hypothetical protein
MLPQRGTKSTKDKSKLRLELILCTFCASLRLMLYPRTRAWSRSRARRWLSRRWRRPWASARARIWFWTRLRTRARSRAWRRTLARHRARRCCRRIRNFRSFRRWRFRHTLRRCKHTLRRPSSDRTQSQLIAALLAAKRHHWRTGSRHLQSYSGISFRSRSDDPPTLPVGSSELVSIDRQGLLAAQTTRVAINKRASVSPRKIHLGCLHCFLRLSLGCCSWSLWRRRILGSECPKPADRQECSQHY